MHVLALLAIVVWPHGLDGASHRWTLRCGPAGGTLPRAVAACEQLATLAAPFAPIPADAMCTAIYGGPAVARVTGSLRGGKVWTTFKRRNGCEIDRWKRVSFLFR